MELKQRIDKGWINCCSCSNLSLSFILLQAIVIVFSSQQFVLIIFCLAKVIGCPPSLCPIDRSTMNPMKTSGSMQKWWGRAMAVCRRLCPWWMSYRCRRYRQVRQQPPPNRLIRQRWIIAPRVPCSQWSDRSSDRLFSHLLPPAVLNLRPQCRRKNRRHSYSTVQIVHVSNTPVVVTPRSLSPSPVVGNDTGNTYHWSLWRCGWSPHSILILEVELQINFYVRHLAPSRCAKKWVISGFHEESARPGFLLSLGML